MSEGEEGVQPRKKSTYVGVPKIYKLQLACRIIEEAYPDSFGCHLVGSALVRSDWRDIDVVCLMRDENFVREFPQAELSSGSFQLDTKWMLNSITLSNWLSEQSGLPVDFKMQPITWANERHLGRRDCLSMRVIKSKKKKATSPSVPA